MAITNPYILGSPVKTKEMFFGREDVFAFLWEHLVGTYQDNVIMLYGQRRTGKTSILYQILNNNRLGDNYVPVLISLEGLQDIETNTHIFLEIARRISKTFGIESPALEKFDATNSYFRYEFLEKKVKPLLNQRKLLLMIDEYEVLEECINNPHTNINKTLFHQLRYLMQHYDWLSFLLVGSHKLEELNADYWKEFTGTIYHTISFLDSESAQNLIEKPAANFSVRYTSDAILYLLQFSGEHPYFLQSLCRFAYKNGAERQEITRKDVEKAIGPCMEAIKNGFESIWQDLKDDEKVILATMADLDSDRISVSDFTDHLAHFNVDWTIEKVLQAIQQLIYRDVLKKTETQQYQSCVPFIEECVKRYQPLEKVLDDLLRIKIIYDSEEKLEAENDLRDAEKYFQQGDLKEAENRFLGVIRNHFGYIVGWLRFGKFHESQGRWDDAIELYQYGLKFHKNSAELLNALGVVLVKKGDHLRETLEKYQYFKDALEQFQNSLRIKKSNIVALTNIEKIERWLADFQDIEILNEIKNKIAQELKQVKFDKLHDERKSYVIDDKNNIVGLNLNNSDLSELPLKLFELKHLQKLYLSNNRITHIPLQITKLPNLQMLDLSNNRLLTLPDNIIELGLEIKWEKDYRGKGVILEGNPLKLPSKEIIEQGKEAIESYFNGIKILLVGDIGVGKTSLIKRLFEEPFDKNEIHTHGIPIEQADIEISANEEIPVSFCDFGGQEVIHFTHWMKRNLYILVLDCGRDRQLDCWIKHISDWSKHIETLGSYSPVLVVFNKIDKNPEFEIKDLLILQKDHKCIQGFYRVSCVTGEGIEKFREKLISTLTNIHHK